MLFVPHLNPATGTLSPLLRVGWTLNLEMYFYALFALAMLLNYRWRVPLTAVAIALVVAVGQMVARPLDVLGFYANDIVVEFVFGMALARIVAARPLRLSGRALALLAAVSLGAILVYSGHQALLPRSIGWGVPSAVLVWCALVYDAGDPVWPRVLVFSGDQSYSLYLTHMFAVSALRLAWHKAHLPEGTALDLVGFGAAALVVAWLMGAASYLLAERPIARALHRA